jgi:hypothetical protein
MLQGSITGIVDDINQGLAQARPQWIAGVSYIPSPTQFDRTEPCLLITVQSPEDHLDRQLLIPWEVVIASSSLTTFVADIIQEIETIGASEAPEPAETA